MNSEQCQDTIELTPVPWLLWGHSGGGYWTLSMIQAYPERILAAFCYSPAWEIPNGKFPETVKDIPVFIRHAGSGEAPGGGCQLLLGIVKRGFQRTPEIRRSGKPLPIRPVRTTISALSATWPFRFMKPF